MKRFLALVAASLLLCACGGNPAADDVLPGFIYRDTLEHAALLRIDHCKGYTVATILNPWRGSRVLQRYILVGADSDMPEALPKGTVVRTPVRSAAVFTGLHAGMLSELGLVDVIAGVCEPQYVTDSLVRARFAEGSVADLGMAGAPNMERLMNLNPDIVIASPFENAGYGGAERLGIPIIEAADYMETDPLGRCQWLALYGELFGCRALTDSVFNATAQRYSALKALAADCPERPSVLLEKRYGSAWSLPAGDSYIARIHSDAGADYLFPEITRNGAQFQGEQILERASDADFWLFKDSRSWTRTALVQEWPLYASFKALGEGRAYACNTTATPYYDMVALHPDRLLAELISIYHPELLPGYERRFYFNL